MITVGFTEILFYCTAIGGYLMSSLTPEMEALKARLRSTWMAGDFGQIAKYSNRGAEEFVSRLPVTPGMKALDVACGTGNVAVAAARRGATTTGVDIARSEERRGGEGGR